MASTRRRRAAKKRRETRCAAKVIERVEEVAEGPGLSRAAWHERQSATDLLAHAAPLLARQHLALVLAAVASGAWKRWHALEPDDWSFAWAIALLRAWALGEVSDEVLRRGVVLEEGGPAFVDPAGRPWASYDDNVLSSNVLAACAAAAARALEVVSCDDPWKMADGVLFATACANAWAAELSARRWFMDLLELDAELEESERNRPSARRSRLSRRVMRQEETAMATAMRAFRKTFRKTSAASVKSIRALVPWVSAPTTEWAVHGPLVVTGEVLLRLDGWEVVDAVRVDELLQLEPERSVAFDQLQERYGAALSARPYLRAHAPCAGGG